MVILRVLLEGTADDRAREAKTCAANHVTREKTASGAKISNMAAPFWRTSEHDQIPSTFS